jgi:hypothetical protein
MKKFDILEFNTTQCTLECGYVTLQRRDETNNRYERPAPRAAVPITSPQHDRRLEHNWFAKTRHVHVNIQTVKKGRGQRWSATIKTKERPLTVTSGVWEDGKWAVKQRGAGRERVQCSPFFFFKRYNGIVHASGGAAVGVSGHVAPNAAAVAVSITAAAPLDCTPALTLPLHAMFARRNSFVVGSHSANGLQQRRR